MKLEVDVLSYPQFERGVLDACIHILDASRMPIFNRGNIIQLIRKGSAMVRMINPPPLNSAQQVHVDQLPVLSEPFQSFQNLFSPSMVKNPRTAKISLHILSRH